MLPCGLFVVCLWQPVATECQRKVEKKTIKCSANGSSYVRKRSRTAVYDSVRHVHINSAPVIIVVHVTGHMRKTWSSYRRRIKKRERERERSCHAVFCCWRIREDCKKSKSLGLDNMDRPKTLTIINSCVYNFYQKKNSNPRAKPALPRLNLRVKQIEKKWWVENSNPTCYFWRVNPVGWARFAISRRKVEGQKVKKPKKVTNPKGPKKMWVPKVKVASDAGVS